MDEITSKAVTIGVAVFITVIIVTVIMFEFDQIQNIYAKVGQTNISFENSLNEFDKYRDSNNVFSGLDVKNAIKKYKNSNVSVCIMEGSTEKCDDSININALDYKKEYVPNFDESTNVYKITFVER